MESDSDSDSNDTSDSNSLRDREQVANGNGGILLRPASSTHEQSAILTSSDTEGTFRGRTADNTKPDPTEPGGNKLSETGDTSSSSGSSDTTGDQDGDIEASSNGD